MARYNIKSIDRGHSYDVFKISKNIRQIYSAAVIRVSSRSRITLSNGVMPIMCFNCASTSPRVIGSDAADPPSTAKFAEKSDIFETFALS